MGPYSDVFRPLKGHQKSRFRGSKGTSKLLRPSCQEMFWDVEALKLLSRAVIG
jgi:hypothetical protein